MMRCIINDDVELKGKYLLTPTLHTCSLCLFVYILDIKSLKPERFNSLGVIDNT
ncbi:hypothetical protein LDVICp096 [lymphocystis disease virus-China]|uniref:Uncharacterized protein n=1 Tax=lymphocystis disease virus-China TaxID=256729 RepID=Q678B6_9VIRU|nr:hypothetical protein LDVICp096 [lymphocystis disease virus-China]AAU10941.1 hypothetical protein [lymphocystis disease virus-China]